MVQGEGDWAGPQPAQALLAVPNVTAHPSTASVPITILLYNASLVCSFNVLIKGMLVIAVVRTSHATDSARHVKDAVCRHPG